MHIQWSHLFSSCCLPKTEAPRSDKSFIEIVKSALSFQSCLPSKKAKVKAKNLKTMNWDLIGNSLNNLKIFLNSRNYAFDCPSMEDVQTLYKNFKGNDLVKEIGKTSFIFNFEGTPYLVMPEFAHGAEKQILPGINLKTGECVALSILIESDERENSKVLYETLNKLSVRYPTEGFLPIQMTKVTLANSEGEIEEKQVLIQPLCLGGELFDFIASFNRDRTQLDSNLKYEFGKSLIQKISILHEAGILHKDLKLENIVLNKEQNKVFLIDFGFAKHILKEQDKEITRTRGSLPYCAPEVVLEIEQTHDEKDDVWSLGLVLYALLSGEECQIVRALNRENAEKFDTVGEYENLLFWNRSEHCDKKSSNKVIELLSKMLNPFRDRRCSMKEVAELFNQIPSDQLFFEHIEVEG